MRQVSLFDDVKKKVVSEPEPEVVEEEKAVESSVYVGRALISKSGDCVHREGYKCVKRGVTVAVDARDKPFSCWKRMNCNDFERR